MMNKLISTICTIIYFSGSFGVNGNNNYYYYKTIDLINEDAGNSGSDSIRFLDINYPLEVTNLFNNNDYEFYGYKIIYDNNNKYIIFKFNDETLNDKLLGNNINLGSNIGINVISSTSNIINTGNQYFCKQCSSTSLIKYGDTCWGITPLSDNNNRECGCNSGSWIGNGIYYGGFNPNECNQCGCWGGAFTGDKLNQEQKGSINSVGFTLQIIFKTLKNPSGFPDMDCFLYNHVNNRANPWSESLSDTHFLSGQESVIINGERNYYWKYCKPRDGDIQYGNRQDLIYTNYLSTFTRGCGGNSALYGIKYIYGNPDYIYGNQYDRAFEFRCKEINPRYQLHDCQWTSNYVNNINENINYQCPNNGILRSIGSIYENGDRRWKFECCKLKYNLYTENEITNMNCYEPNYFENDYYNQLNVVPSTTQTYFLNGMESEFLYSALDRKYKFRRCKPSDGTDEYVYTSTTTLDTTDISYPEWTKSCSSENNGHSAIIGIIANYNNYHKDRNFQIKCGNLDRSRYGLSNCGYTGEINNFHQINNFNCMGNGVIRSIYSNHLNSYEDRIFKVECCNIVPGKFSKSIGFWNNVISCNGCGTISHSVKVGTITTNSETTTESYRNEFSQSISLGFEFRYGTDTSSGSTTSTYTVTTTEAQTTSTALTNSVAVWQFTTQQVTCSKNYLYQWTQTAYDYTNKQDVTLKSLSFICTDTQNPQCPLGWCDNDDCTQCKSGYSG